MGRVRVEENAELIVLGVESGVNRFRLDIDEIRLESGSGSESVMIVGFWRVGTSI
jgi:hypothetical protein